jgi:maleylacetate reductase
LKVLPEVVIYDVALTLSLPVAVSSASGMNAIAHAVEALYAKDANPLTSTLAIQGIQALRDALPKIQLNPLDKEARSNALYGAWLCGLCLAQVGMSLHHKLCHTVGGSFNLPHAETHSVILPHAVAYNASAAPQAMQQLASALGVSNAAQGLFDLATTLKLNTSLKALGMKEEQLVQATDLALANPYWSPRAIERTGIAQLLEDAFHGRRPVAV